MDFTIKATAGDISSAPIMPQISNIAIIGAGAAGLITAQTLLSAGFTVTIYEKNDYIGADMVRKYIQFGSTKLVKNKDIFKKLEMINNNLKYIEWINTFNWKKTDPYKPKQYIINL